jgi:transcription antitermination factor NusA-like protein
MTQLPIRIKKDETDCDRTAMVLPHSKLSLALVKRGRLEGIFEMLCYPFGDKYIRA